IAVAVTHIWVVSAHWRSKQRWLNRVLSPARNRYKSRLSRRRVAADLGVGLSTLGKWVSQYRPSDLGSTPSTDLAKENERLRLENRILKEEREILKKATQFFASQRP